MPHPTSGRCGLAGDEADHGLLHALAHELRRLLLVGATDLAHHGDGLRLRVSLERGKAVDEVGAVDRIASDADTGALPHAGTGELIDDLVGERARAAHDADVARRADAPGN